jgi:hypothetical protein
MKRVRQKRVRPIAAQPLPSRAKRRKTRSGRRFCLPCINMQFIRMKFFEETKMSVSAAFRLSDDKSVQGVGVQGSGRYLQSFRVQNLISPLNPEP